ncbi:MAG: Methionine aminopeptidase [Planctomycetota bacterium]|jgi:methionyl aminopeptidase
MQGCFQQPANLQRIAAATPSPAVDFDSPSIIIPNQPLAPALFPHDHPARSKVSSVLKKKIPLYLTSEEREGLRAAGKFNAKLIDFLRQHVAEGISTDKLDRLAHTFTTDHGHVPACLNYKGYPRTICASINEVVCHGIPNTRPLKSGDIVNIDVTTIVDGWYGDQSETFLIGDVSDVAKRLVQTTFDSLFVGIAAARPGCAVIEIGRAIQSFAARAGYSVVREYQGHGIGRDFHQEPGIPHVPQLASAREFLHPGTCFTIEPMLNIGTWETVLDKRDKWTVRTRDNTLSAQFEHTLLMTENGPEILTLTQHGPQQGHRF